MSWKVTLTQPNRVGRIAQPRALTVLVRHCATPAQAARSAQRANAGWTATLLVGLS